VDGFAHIAHLHHLRQARADHQLESADHTHTATWAPTDLDLILRRRTSHDNRVIATKFPDLHLQLFYVDISM
jgi:hypothetical protein